MCALATGIVNKTNRTENTLYSNSSAPKRIATPIRRHKAIDCSQMPAQKGTTTAARTTTQTVPQIKPNLQQLFTPLDKLLFWLGAAFMVATGVTLLVRFEQVGELAQVLSTTDFGIDDRAATELCVSMGVLAVICWTFAWMGTLCLNTLKDRQLKAWSAFAMRAALSQEPAWLESSGVTSQLHQFPGAALAIAHALSIDGYGGVFDILGQSLGGIVIGFAWTPWWFVLMLLTPTLLIIFALWPPLIGRFVKSGGVSAYARSMANAPAIEALQAHRTVAAFGLEETVLKQFATKLAPVRLLLRQNQLWYGLLQGLGGCPSAIGFIIGFMYSILHVAHSIERSSFDYQLPAPQLGPNATRALCYTSSVWDGTFAANATCLPGTTHVQMSCQLAELVVASSDGLSWLGLPNRQALDDVLSANGSFGPCSPTVRTTACKEPPPRKYHL